jgi:hypothetical protein
MNVVKSLVNDWGCKIYGELKGWHILASKSSYPGLFRLYAVHTSSDRGLPSHAVEELEERYNATELPTVCAIALNSAEDQIRVEFNRFRIEIPVRDVCGWMTILEEFIGKHA